MDSPRKGRRIDHHRSCLSQQWKRNQYNTTVVHAMPLTDYMRTTVYLSFNQDRQSLVTDDALENVIQAQAGLDDDKKPRSNNHTSKEEQRAATRQHGRKAAHLFSENPYRHTPFTSP
eukprot:6184054-Pleurochrysis_carterae.AAC.1